MVTCHARLGADAPFLSPSVFLLPSSGSCMASIIWIDSDAEDVDDLVEFIEPPTPRKLPGTGPLAGPSTIANTPRRTKETPQKKRARSPVSDSDIEIIESTPRAAKITKSKHDEDRAIALALQKKWDEEDALAQKQAAETEEKSMRLIARLQEMDQSMADKRRKLAQQKDVPDDGIVFHVVIDADGKTLEGDDDPDNAAHLDLVKRDFEQVLATGFKVKKVHWFVNAKLEARFEKAKEVLNSRGIDSTERNLFHGTAAANIQPILENGFLIPGVSPGVQMVNGAACGIGIYLATTPAISFAYTQGAFKMFMCRVITGRSTPIVSQAIPRALGENDFESWTANGVYVSKHVELVVPRYVVEFEQNGRLGPAMMPLPGMPAMPLMPMPFLAMPLPFALPFPPPPVAAPAVRARKRAPAKPRKPATKGKGKAKRVDDPEEDEY
ncbi:hypothetical protein C8R44DRAFT_808495 [Mycena epipterygia]|nr:hypothetical protein C8R44DRAFT_808495 [Mycena epipterygia]